jgi:hypothetical protein
MTALGWVFLIASLVFVVALTGWCYYKVLSVQEDPPDPVKDFHNA